MIRRLLEHPLTRGVDLDSPEIPQLRRAILRAKPALRALYGEWYRELATALPPVPGRVLELGSGGGFLDEILPGVIRSDVVPTRGLQAALSGVALPFAESSLRAVLMTNVLHHLAEPSRFFDDAARCVRRGGVVAMIEPWNNRWSRFVYRGFHHEPFEPDAGEWNATPSGPLSTGNGALPWILFERDREAFRARHPEWRLRRVRPHTPFGYLLAGGVSLRELLPHVIAIPLARKARASSSLSRRAGMFATILLERVTTKAD